jgi:uncharacterized protein YidB (DUF937 family)
MGMLSVSARNFAISMGFRAPTAVTRATGFPRRVISIGSPALTGDASGGGISGMLETLAANGLAEHVASWTGDGQNLSVSPDQIRDALGSDQAQQMAQASGLPLGDFLKHLADQLPAAASATQDP